MCQQVTPTTTMSTVSAAIAITSEMIALSRMPMRWIEARKISDATLRPMMCASSAPKRLAR
jgi:hypothetical protein